MQIPRGREEEHIAEDVSLLHKTCNMRAISACEKQGNVLEIRITEQRRIPTPGQERGRKGEKCKITKVTDTQQATE